MSTSTTPRQHLVPVGGYGFRARRSASPDEIPRFGNPPRFRFRVNTSDNVRSDGTAARSSAMSTATQSRPTEKYRASGLWKTIAETEASGAIIIPSVSRTPMSVGRNSSKRMR